MSNIAELQADLDELMILQKQAKRPNTARILEREIKQLTPVLEEAKKLKQIEDEKKERA